MPSTHSALIVIFSLSLSACITFRDDGKGNYRVGLKAPENPPEHTQDPAHNPAQNAPDRVQTTDPVSEAQPDPKESLPSRDITPMAVATVPPEVPSSIVSDEEATPNIVVAAFKNVEVSLVATPDNRPTLRFLTPQTEETISLTFEPQGCDQLNTNGAVIQPGLLALSYTCVSEGGDNNYTGENVVILQYSGIPKSRTDFHVRWTGQGSQSATGYYADDSTVVVFVVEGTSVVAVAKVRSGCASGADYESEDPEPCKPTTETTRTVIFPL